MAYKREKYFIEMEGALHTDGRRMSFKLVAYANLSRKFRHRSADFCKDIQIAYVFSWEWRRGHYERVFSMKNL